jgi:hypothetical protein
MTPPLLSFDQQRAFWKHVRELVESARDVALNPGRDTQGAVRAHHRHEKARNELSLFMDPFIEKPKAVAP